jgi:hypothetical protein
MIEPPARLPGDMEPVEGCPIDLKPWVFLDESVIDKEVGRIVSEVIADEFKKTPPYLYFHNGDADPVMLRIDLGLGPSEGEPATFAVSLEGVIDDVIESFEWAGTGQVDLKGAAICQAIAGRLRQLADKLEGACKMIVHPKMPHPGDRAVVFAHLPGLSCSVCAPVSMSEAEVEAFALAEIPPPNDAIWKATDLSEEVPGLTKTPNPCNIEPDARRHWCLMIDK